MSSEGKVERVIELNCSAEKFYNVFKSQAFHVPTHAADHIQGVDIHDQDWDSHGHDSIKTWKYTVEGEGGEFKEQVALDDANTTVTLISVGGDVMKVYKKFNPVYKVTPKQPQGCVADLSIEYETPDPSVPPPEKYVDMMVGITQGIDAGITAGAGAGATAN